MIAQVQFIAIFFLQLVVIYLISRRLINLLFFSLRRIFKNDQMVYNLIALLFLPGTIIHEISHFLAATLLLLRVRSVTILPEWKEHYLKLGSVIYEKKDLLRSILVGIAPLFGGLAFFWLLAAFQLFPQNNWWLNLLFGYLVFTVATNMFSSAKDLQDLIYILPLIAIVIAVIYIFNIRINLVFAAGFWENISTVLQQINIYLLISLALEITLWGLLKLMNWVIKR